ncbi:hypothetical protein OLZ31_26375, partial [Enterobacter asburiae]|nr:hypothetical protein [Enterobacter asburiae]
MKPATVAVTTAVNISARVAVVFLFKGKSLPVTHINISAKQREITLLLLQIFQKACTTPVTGAAVYVLTLSVFYS